MLVFCLQLQLEVPYQLVFFVHVTSQGLELLHIPSDMNDLASYPLVLLNQVISFRYQPISLLCQLISLRHQLKIVIFLIFNRPPERNILISQPFKFSPQPFALNFIFLQLWFRSYLKTKLMSQFIAFRFQCVELTVSNIFVVSVLSFGCL